MEMLNFGKSLQLVLDFFQQTVNVDSEKTEMHLQNKLWRRNKRFAAVLVPKGCSARHAAAVFLLLFLKCTKTRLLTWTCLHFVFFVSSYAFLDGSFFSGFGLFCVWSACLQWV